jgi:serine protease Do
MTPMGALFGKTTKLSHGPLAIIAAAAILWPTLSGQALARGPENIADTAEAVIDAVVNISTKQTVDISGGGAMPQLPPGSPFEEFFEEFFKNRRGQGGPGGQGTPGAPGRQGGGEGSTPRRINSLGSGFIIDPAGFVVTNNHVIADADEVSVILNNGTTLKAEVLGRDTKTDLALLKVSSPTPLKAVKFGDSDRLRLGEWVVAIGNPFSLGGTVTAGIVSARNRDINSGPYDNYIQTDAAINRGNSGGPLFNLDGDVIGVNTAIISPSGGSIGIGFAVPSKTVVAVIDQLREFKEVRRGWLGVRIQQVTDEIAESLSIKPARGALIAGIDDKGPAKPAGIEPGDVVIKFDGKDIKEMRDLPKIVAETPVGKDVEVTIVRKGKEEKKTVRLGRLEDTEKKVAAVTKKEDVEEKPAIKKALGLDLANLSDDLRKKYKIKDKVKGVVITGVDANSPASEKRLAPGMVIAEVQQQAVANATDLQKRVEQLKKEGKKAIVLLVVSPDGDPSFVALSLQ